MSAENGASSMPSVSNTIETTEYIIIPTIPIAINAIQNTVAAAKSANDDRILFFCRINLYFEV
jgi:hypothetical protein